MVGQHKEVKVGCTCHCCYHKVNNYKITLVLSLLLQTKAYMNVTPYYQHIFPRNFINTLQIFFQKYITPFYQHFQFIYFFVVFFGSRNIILYLIITLQLFFFRNLLKTAADNWI